MGRSFSIKAKANELVNDRDLFADQKFDLCIRNAMITGSVLILQRSSAWILMVAIILGQTIRARSEAGLLEAAFYDAHREYRRKTWVLKMAGYGHFARESRKT